MQFAYQGFTQNGNQRIYRFAGVEGRLPDVAFVIQIDLVLFAKHQVSIQNGPTFCLRLLQEALVAGPLQLEKLHDYHVADIDFASILAERVLRSAKLAMKKPPRRPVRTPPSSSQLRGVGRPEIGPQPSMGFTRKP